MDPFERGRHGKLLTEAERGVIWPQGSTANGVVYPLLHEIAPQPPSDVVYPLLSELNPQPSSDVVYPLLSELNPQPSSDVVYPLLHELRPQPPSDVVYLQIPNESLRWPSPATFPIVQANGMVGVPGWFGGAGQPGLTELERQRQQQMRPDVARGFPEYPNTGAAHPINMQFIQPLEPEVLLIYTDDSFVSEQAYPDLYSMYSPGEGKSGFRIQATSHGFSTTKGVGAPSGYTPGRNPRDIGKKRGGPLIAKGTASSAELMVEVLSGERMPLTSVLDITKDATPEDATPLPVDYPRGVVEFWGVWFFRIPASRLARSLSFVVANHPVYEFTLRTGERKEPTRAPVSAEIRGEIFVSKLVNSAPLPIEFVVRTNQSFFVMNPTDPRNLDAHEERALEWKAEFSQSSRTHTVATQSNQHPIQPMTPNPPTRQVYSFQAVENQSYGIIYIDYIQVKNGNGSAFAKLVSSPNILLYEG